MFFNFKGHNLIQKSIEWVFYVFIALFPFISYNGFLFAGTASRAVNLAVFAEILVLIFCFLLFDKKNDFFIVKSPITLALALLLIVSSVSAFQGVDFLSSFWSKATRMTGLFYFLHLAVFYLFLLMVLSKEKTLRNFLRVFLISAGIFSAGALLSNDGFGFIFADKPWTGFTFGNSSFAAMYLYAAFLASVYFIISSEKLKKHWWRFIIPLIFVINPYFINIDLWYGRVNIFKNPFGVIGEAQASSFVMFFSIAALFLAWLILRIKKNNLRTSVLWGVSAAGIIIAIIATFSLFSNDGYLRRAYLKQASNARPLVWELSKESIKDRPMLGWGGDNFDRSFEKHYDNRIVEQKNGAEPWFDRAHNIFIDQTVETGYLGLGVYILVYLTILGAMLYVILRSGEKRDQALAAVLAVYFVGHFLELQTAFETSISYVSLVIMAALSSHLFYKTYRAEKDDKSEWRMPQGLRYALGSALFLFFGYLVVVGTIPITRAEIANGTIRTIGSSEKRLPIYSVLFGSPLDRASFLWKTTNDFQRGVAQKPAIIEDSKKREGLIKELAIHTEEYRKYANEHPIDYRVRVSLAGVYIYERLLNVNHLNEAHKVLDDAISLSPRIPQAYWMKSVAYLYQRKFDLAREWAKKAYDLNPGIEQSQKIIDYIERSIKTFPEIDFYTFGQI